MANPTVTVTVPTQPTVVATAGSVPKVIFTAIPGTIIQGDSAYEVWLAAGHTGTEDEFLASLVGRAGADSTVPGPRGLQGDPGAKGDTGAPASPSSTIALTIALG